MLVLLNIIRELAFLRKRPQIYIEPPTARGETMGSRLEEFLNYRTRMNDRILKIDHLGIKRFFNLDTTAYNDGALDGKTKELLGLAASAVLRCNDCIDYHLLQCVEAGWKDEELYDALNVSLIVGGVSSSRTCAMRSRPSICSGRRRRGQSEAQVGNRNN
jgi:AhpD family alkylhydroperoxidase